MKYPFLITINILTMIIPGNILHLPNKSQDDNFVLGSPHNEVQLHCIRLDHRRLPRAQMLRIGMGEPAEHGLLMVDINIFHVYHQNRDVMSIVYIYYISWNMCIYIYIHMYTVIQLYLISTINEY